MVKIHTNNGFTGLIVKIVHQKTFGGRVPLDCYRRTYTECVSVRVF